MKPNIPHLFTILVVIANACLWNSCKPSDPVDFSSQIKPILNTNCIVCHGGVKKNAGFSLLFEEDALGNTESGKPAIIPGDANGSELIRRLKENDPELRMPYKKHQLSDDEIDLISKWINEGAKWGKHWAYTLPEKVEVPLVKEEAGLLGTLPSHFLQNNIDNFILRRLTAENLLPSNPADKEIIARRVAFDITGLPPNRGMFNKWMDGEMDYETLIDSLLAQKAYGEKWSSWWLDLARYADTKGYEKDQGRTMWQYRDWVIKAFNKDMPYDKFTVEQLAGDLLPEPSVDQLIATAFHRNTMNNDEGGTEDEEFRVATVLDRVNTTFEVWQSTTIGCVQCHSHTYDPFRHDEYYKLMAFFNNSRDEDTPGEEPALKFYNQEQLKELAKVKEWTTQYGNKKISKQYEDFMLFNEPIYQAHLCEDFNEGELADTKWLALWNNGSCKMKNVWTHGASYMFLNYWSDIDGTKMTIKKNNADGEILTEFTINKTAGKIIRKIPFKKIDKKVTLYFEANNDRIPDEVSTSFIVWLGFLPDMPGEKEAGFEKVHKTFLDVLNTETPTLPIMGENPDYMKRTTQVFERGNWLLKADTVLPGTPQVLNPWKEQWPTDRMGLSQWIVNKENPLTARTLVNRVWHQIFGRGIVASLEDIGTQSDPPSHPELLDWLSLRFMNEHHWSIKGLIKDIVLSGTYRQKSENNAELYQIDPENQFYARGPRRRLSAEQIRDQALAISELLSKKMFGPSVMPPQPEGIWKSVYSGEKWVESEGEDKYRRGLYTYLKRTSPYPSFVTFDAGSREVCTIRRTVTNTPLQALVTLNDPVYLEAAYHLAKNTMSDGDVDKAIAASYKKATYLEITPTKLHALKQLYVASLSEFENDKEALNSFLHFESNPSSEKGALAVVANAIMNLDEFLTKS